MTEKLLSIKTKDDYILKTHIIPAAEEPKGVIVYYHGGGLISGSPTDLSENIVKILTQSFHLVLTLPSRSRI